MKKQQDKKCAFKALLEKMEKLDRDMREVKETLLRLREQILNPEELAQLKGDNELFTEGNTKYD